LAKNRRDSLLTSMNDVINHCQHAPAAAAAGPAAVAGIHVIVVITGTPNSKCTAQQEYV